MNIRLDRAEDPLSRQLTNVLASHGLTCRVTAATHNLGGLLDVVATRDDLVSDRRHHRCWTVGPPAAQMVNAARQTESGLLSTVTSRPWRQLDAVEFRERLSSSSLCRPDVWPQLDIDGLARLYDDQITVVLDRLIPVRTVTCRRRPSDPWFDSDCRAAKRLTRRLERAARRTDPADAAAATAATAAWTQQRRLYTDLLRSKRESFWQAKVEAERSSPRQLWKSIDALMGRGRVQSCDTIGAAEFHHFFETKVNGVRDATADAPLPSFSSVSSDCSLLEFQQLTIDDVVAVVRSLPDKQCSSDPLQTRLLKENVDVLAPFLVELANRSLSTGTVPAAFKAAYITPLLKKPDLDSADFKSYRPVSNLSVLSKLLERLVARQLLDYLSTAGLLPKLQSAYRKHHSTETAVLRVLADILQALDSGNIAALALLDLSAAFDTVDHAILLQRLATSYGLGGHALKWFSDYLDRRTQCVRRGSSRSTPTTVSCGVPQGSVLGPILFLLYTADLLLLIERINYGATCMRTTRRYTVPAPLLLLCSCLNVCLRALMKW